MSMSAGPHGGQYLEVDQVHTGPGPQQLHHHVIVGLAAGQVQGGLAVTVEHVQLSPRPTHQPHDDAVTLECRVVKRPPASVVPVILIQAPVKQNLNKMQSWSKVFNCFADMAVIQKCMNLWNAHV